MHWEISNLVVELLHIWENEICLASIADIIGILLDGI